MNTATRTVIFLAVIALVRPVIGDVVQVDCSSPDQTLTQALNTAKLGDTLRITGTCKETVTITTDDLTLEGDNQTVLDGHGTNRDVLTIDGARRVAIKQMTVQHGANGIHITRGATVTIDGVTVQDNADDGMEVGHNATATIAQTTAQRNADDGFVIDQNATATFTNCIAKDNHDNGFFVLRAASAQFIGTTMSMGNGHNGVRLSLGAGATLTGTVTSANNKRSGIDIALSASGSLNRAMVTVEKNGRRGISVAMNGSLLTAGGTLESNRNKAEGIRVSTGGSLALLGTTTRVDGNRDGLVVALSASVYGSKKTKIIAQNNAQFGVVVFADASGILLGEVNAEANPAWDCMTQHPSRKGNQWCLHR